MAVLLTVAGCSRHDPIQNVISARIHNDSNNGPSRRGRHSHKEQTTHRSGAIAAIDPGNYPSRRGRGACNKNYQYCLYAITPGAGAV